MHTEWTKIYKMRTRPSQAAATKRQNLKGDVSRESVSFAAAEHWHCRRRSLYLTSCAVGFRRAAAGAGGAVCVRSSVRRRPVVAVADAHLLRRLPTAHLQSSGFRRRQHARRRAHDVGGSATSVRPSHDLRPSETADDEQHQEQDDDAGEQRSGDDDGRSRRETESACPAQQLNRRRRSIRHLYVHLKPRTARTIH